MEMPPASNTQRSAKDESSTVMYGAKRSARKGTPRSLMFLNGIAAGVGVMIVVSLLLDRPPPEPPPKQNDLQTFAVPQTGTWESLREVTERLESVSDEMWADDTLEFAYESVDYAFEARRVRRANGKYVIHVRPIPKLTRPVVQGAGGGKIFWTVPKGYTPEQGKDPFRQLPDGGARGPGNG